MYLQICTGMYIVHRAAMDLVPLVHSYLGSVISCASHKQGVPVQGVPLRLQPNVSLDVVLVLIHAAEISLEMFISNVSPLSAGSSTGCQV